MKESLPEPLPDDPLPLIQAWLAEASAASRNAAAMTLATVTPDGRPAARMVICRGVDARAGWLVFYTDRESEKGHELTAHPRAALVFHWAELERQVRVDGPVTLAPDADSDRYWATRPRDARVAAVASPAEPADRLARRAAGARGRGGPHRRRCSAATALGRLSGVGRAGRAVGRAAGPRARSRPLDAHAGADGRRRYTREPVAGHAPDAMTTTLPIQERVRLGPLTTLGVGGRALVRARAGRDHGQAALAWAREHRVELRVLGGGSNLVVADEGVDAVVVQIALRGVRTQEVDGALELTAAAGEPWDGVVRTAVERGWAGLECLSGIPGLVGATPIQNVGAYGQEVSDTITAVRALDTQRGAIVTVPATACGFTYRDSVVQERAAGAMGRAGGHLSATAGRRADDGLRRRAAPAHHARRWAIDAGRRARHGAGHPPNQVDGPRRPRRSQPSLAAARSSSIRSSARSTPTA